MDTFNTLDYEPLITAAMDKGLVVDGFNLSHIFPKGTNYTEIASKGVTSNTLDLLKFHLRRSLLSVAHWTINRYAMFPHVAYVGDGLRSALSIPNTNALMDHHDCLNALSGLKLGPERVATSLLYHPAPRGRFPEKLISYKLASGEVIHPTTDDILMYRRECLRVTELNRSKHNKAIDKVISHAVRVAEWAVRTPSIKVITVYEHSGILLKKSARFRKALTFHLEGLPQLKERSVSIKFQDTSNTRESDLTIIFASDKLRGESVLETFGADATTTQSRVQLELTGTEEHPQVFIAFNGCTNGFPLAAIGDAHIYTPERRDLLVDSSPKLEDFVAGLLAWRDSPERVE